MKMAINMDSEQPVILYFVVYGIVCVFHQGGGGRLHRHLVYSNQTTGFRGWGQAGSLWSKACQKLIVIFWTNQALYQWLKGIEVLRGHPHLNVTVPVSRTYCVLLLMCAWAARPPTSQLMGFCWHCGWLRLERTYPEVHHLSDCHLLFLPKSYFWNHFLNLD